MAHKHAKSGGPGGGVNLNIIITPMLDMAFQLLAFFIMTYHPSALEGHIDGTLLPPTKVSTKSGDPLLKDTTPVDEEPKFTEAVLVKVRAVPKGQIEGGKKDGEPRFIEITRVENAAVPVTLSGDANARDLEDFVKSLEKELDRELKKVLKDTGQGNDIKLEADADLKHRYWMRYYDVCKLAGFKNIHFVSPPTERKN